MHPIDRIEINFNEGDLTILNLLLAFIMFGIALDIRLDDFRRIFHQPKTPVIGLISEYLMLPLLTLGLIYLLRPAASLGLGMMLLAVCPGGSVSNFMVHISKGNTALSVMLTSITTIGAIVITPLAFGFWADFVPKSEALSAAIQVDPERMFRVIIQLILLPVSLGMLVSYRFPKVRHQIRKPIQILSMILFLGFVTVAVIANLQKMYSYLYIVFFIVLIHNGLSLLMGYWFARLNGLEEADSRAVCIETGIQNSGLGLLLVFNFFNGLGGMALILAWWGVWHLISGYGLSMYWSRRPPVATTSRPFILSRFWVKK